MNSVFVVSMFKRLHKLFSSKDCEHYICSVDAYDVKIGPFSMIFLYEKRS